MAERPSRGDVAVGLAFCVVSQAEIWLTEEGPWRLVLSLVVAGVSIAVMWRRVLPTASSAVVLSGLATTAAVQQSQGLWEVGALVLTMFSVARHAPTARAVALLATGVAYTALTAVLGGSVESRQLLVNLFFVGVLMVAVPWCAGYTLRKRERLSVSNAAAAVDEERLRIARELHDVVSHSLAVIAVQAGAEQATLGEDVPESTRRVLETIEQTSHEALEEMRRQLTVMRAADHGVAVQPTLGQLDTILDAARQAGWHCALTVVGDPVRLSAGLNLAAYRIIQEAVTNAVRHSRGTRADITLRYLDDELEVEVEDDGAGASARPGGFGLTGMGERAALYGGRVETGRSGTGGFRVRAVLPYAQDAPPSARPRASIGSMARRRRAR
ncbi:MAG TPA: sensor histidine kinase [Ornithinibacter sp.]|nr:sensor histidine kinase [Ornithinibacter sp.]